MTPEESTLLIKHERELREQYARLTELALEKQAAVYDRRLDDLNHAHARALEDKARFLERSFYEQTQKELQVWRVQVGEDLVRLRAETGASQRTWGIVLTLAMLALSVVNILAR